MQSDRASSISGYSGASFGGPKETSSASVQQVESASFRGAQDVKPLAVGPRKLFGLSKASGRLVSGSDLRINLPDFRGVPSFHELVSCLFDTVLNVYKSFLFLSRF